MLKPFQTGLETSLTWWDLSLALLTALRLDFLPYFSTSSQKRTSFGKKLMKSTQTWNLTLTESNWPSGQIGMSCWPKSKSKASSKINKIKISISDQLEIQGVLPSLPSFVFANILFYIFKHPLSTLPTWILNYNHRKSKLL